jgi:acyl carrier protein
MEQHETFTAVVEILRDVAGVAPALVTPAKHLADELEVDSLSMVEVVVAAENRFGVKIPDEEVDDITTVADLVDRIRAAVPA